jgi:polysaccharide export outer membrane protein
VTEFATQGIKVLGEVNQPGIYPLLGPHRLLDAISAAGGLTVKAGSVVTVVHAPSGASEQIALPQNALDLKNNIPLQPGDMIMVSKAGLVYVVGEVTRPGAFLMENNTTVSLLRAIALAQGVTKIAAENQVSILRKTPQGTVQIQIRLDLIFQAKAADPLLQPNDIVFIPISGRKNFMQRGTEAIIQAATGVAIYGAANL